ncbi:hypothetical protein GOP47_0002781 [Adiantum capillus-veneris]|uniref:Uncharacterized protein n=1 Tax=Adiantum capillus-veneris TaxID=13818 RepID=A0A9D4VB74_ADICA|nr:hypothetical protein GOP47_0002781 [Adiantum capillus-veneris]
MFCLVASLPQSVRRHHYNGVKSLQPYRYSTSRPSLPKQSWQTREEELLGVSQRRHLSLLGSATPMDMNTLHLISMVRMEFINKASAELDNLLGVAEAHVGGGAMGFHRLREGMGVPGKEQHRASQAARLATKGTHAMEGSVETTSTEGCIGSVEIGARSRAMRLRGEWARAAYKLCAGNDFSFELLDFEEISRSN